MKEELEVAASENASQATDGEFGLLDHLVQMEEGFQALEEIISNVAGDINRIGHEVEQVSSRIDAARQNPSQGTNKHIQKLAKGLGKRTTAFAKKLASANQRYTEVNLKTGTSLEFILDFPESITEDERSELEGFLEQMEVLQSAAKGGKDSFAELAETMENAPKLERHLNRALGTASEEIYRFVDNVDRTVIMAEEASRKAHKLLA